MANVEKAERKTAPAVEVRVPHKDQREGIRLAYAEKYPEYSFAYHRPNVSDIELEMIQAEKITDGAGGFVHHGGDPLIRIPMKVVEAQRAAEQQDSLKLVENKMKEAKLAGRLTRERKPKTPKVPIKKE
jgi:hypothetical protein